MKKTKKPPKDKLYLIGYPVYRIRVLATEDNTPPKSCTVHFPMKVPIYLGESSKIIGYARIRRGVAKPNLYFADIRITDVRNDTLKKLSSGQYEFQPAVQVHILPSKARVRIRQLLLVKGYANRKKLMMDVYAPAEYAEAVQHTDSN